MGSLLYKVSVKMDKVLEDLETVKKKLDELSTEVKAPRPKTVYLSVGAQRTVEALKTLAQPATASQVSRLTGRARAVESAHLNMLFYMGLVKKERRGRYTVFTFKEEANQSGLD